MSFHSYRYGDVVAIEKGCDWFITVWSSLKQVKYVAAFHKQVDQLLVWSPTSWHVESQLNRTTQAYPQSTGKPTFAHDEYIKLGDCLPLMFPEMNSLKGMIRAGTYAGMAQRSKKFTQKHYKIKQYGEKKKVNKKKPTKIKDGNVITRAGTRWKQTQERQHIYELFTILFRKKDQYRKLSTETVCCVLRRRNSPQD